MHFRVGSNIARHFKFAQLDGMRGRVDNARVDIARVVNARVDNARVDNASVPCASGQCASGQGACAQFERIVTSLNRGTNGGNARIVSRQMNYMI